jgi:hypothetical protein
MMSPSSPIAPAGREASLFNDEIFRQLRQLAGVPDTFVNDGWSFETLESGGAKGGCLMAFLGSEFVVKELSSDDHESLLSISKSYFDHVRGGDTTLSAILLHFEDQLTGRRFFVMRNVIGGGPFLALYDLKGCNDDKTIELFGSKLQACGTLMSKAGRWCGIAGSECWYDSFSAGKHAAARADLVVTESQRTDVLHRIHRDTAWLKSHQLMDYSMIVGVKTGPPGFAGGRSMGRLPLVHTCADGSEVAVCVGIIDFLQQWNWKKIAARAIKCLECNKATIPPKAYARRFCMYFEERFTCAAHIDKADVRPQKVGKPLPTLLEGLGGSNGDKIVASPCSKNADERVHEEGALLEFTANAFA